MEVRNDALLSAAKMIVTTNELARKFGGLTTTGILNVLPGSINTIPGEVSFSLDIRARSDGELDDMEDAIKRSFAGIVEADAPESLSIEWTLDAQSPVIEFSDDAIACIQGSCESMFQENMDILVSKMQSGAGHDSVFTSRRAPTAMAFVPCKNGISHTPEEYCDPSDCGTGAQIMLNSILRFDDRRN